MNVGIVIAVIVLNMVVVNLVEIVDPISGMLIIVFVLIDGVVILLL